MILILPDTKDLGKYLCVAENQGGVMEKEVVFTFDDPNTFYKPITDEQGCHSIDMSQKLQELSHVLGVDTCLNL